MLQRISAVLAVLTLFGVAASTHAATLTVVLPGDAALHVVDELPPPAGPRISCPPTCTYSSDGPSIGILDLRVTQEEDPRTNGPPYDILTMDGCTSTPALPTTNGLCRVPSEGNATISFTTRYRPVIAVTSGGTIGAEVFNLFVNGGPGPDYQGNGTSFSCDVSVPANAPPEQQAERVRRCARHVTVDQPVFVQPTDLPPTSELVSASAPCALGPVPGNAQRCDFTITEDTCISVLYLHTRPPPFAEKTIGGPPCPSGPGVEGTHSGGGDDIPPELTPVKALALEAMRAEFERVVYPCLVGSSGVSVYLGLAALGPAVSIMIGGSLVAASTPLCATGIRRLMQFQLIVNDPPDPNFQDVAKVPKRTKALLDLPDCSGFSGSEKRFCKKLGKGLTKYVEKDDRASDIAETLRITVERAVGAHQSNDEKALKKQLRALKKRQRQLDGAVKKRARQGAKLARLFEKEQIIAVLDEDQFTAGAEAALGHLAAEGLPEEDARTLLDTALDSETLDLLSVVAR